MRTVAATRLRLENKDYANWRRKLLQTFMTEDEEGEKWARHYIGGLSKSALMRRFFMDIFYTTPAVLGTLLFNRRTRDYMRYLTELEDRLDENLGSRP